MEAEDALEEGILDISLDELEDGFVALKADEGGGDFDHVHEVEEGDVGEFDEAFLEDEFSLANHLLVAFDVIFRSRGGELGDFAEGFRFVGVVGEAATVVELDVVEGVDGDDFDVVFDVATGSGEEFIEHEGGGDDGGAGVEGEAILLVDVGATAELIAGFEELDLVAAGLEADGDAEAAETAADDDDFLEDAGGGGGQRFWHGTARRSTWLPNSRACRRFRRLGSRRQPGGNGCRRVGDRRVRGSWHGRR